MSERLWQEFAGDIITSCNKISNYISGMDIEDFISDDRTYNAVLRNLEIIGEAAKHIPEEIREIHNDIEWRKIMDLRNIIIHDYIGIDENIIWDLIGKKVPDLKIKIENILK
jgi:uncharacterized protein with HEPN domain